MEGPSHHSSPAAPRGNATTAELLGNLSRFEGPPEQFLVSLVAFQCHVSDAAAGCILRCPPDKGADVLAVWPPLPADATAPPVWLAAAVQAAPAVAAAEQGDVKPLHAADDLYGQASGHHLVMVPLIGGTGVRGVAAFLSRQRDPARLAESRQRLELTTALMSLYEMRLTLQARQNNVRRLKAALETLAAMNRQTRFAAAGMALCNEMAARWQCQRVSLGFVRGRYVHARAMSHTEKFSRKMDVVRHIEGAMEECADQDLEIVQPAGPQATYVCRAATELSRKHGPLAVVSLPLRQDAEVVGVVTVEREMERPFTADEVESLRLACELCGPRIIELDRRGRWFGPRWARGIRKGLGVLVGPRHTWAKVAAVALLALIVTTVLATGDYHAEGAFQLEAVEHRTVPAPYDGILEDVFVEPSDAVAKGQTLGTLFKADMERQLAATAVKKAQSELEAVSAMQQGKTAEERIARLEARKYALDMKLLQSRIERATLVAPIKGSVVGEDLNRLEGMSVKLGQELFRVQPARKLRAELLIPEDQIIDLVEAFRAADVRQQDLLGELNTESRPGEAIAFKVERISPVAEVVEGQNVFRVRVQLLEIRPWMASGMTGMSRVTVGRRPLAWIYSRRLINWVRLKFWF